jgi:Sulfotransferase family
MDMLQPIFIGGCPRSGTTMLGSMIGSMSSCIVTPESIFKQSYEIPVAWLIVYILLLSLLTPSLARQVSARNNH